MLALHKQPVGKPTFTYEFDFFGLATRIKRNDQNAMIDLYRLMQEGVRSMVQQRMGGREQSVQDRVHDIFLITVSAIREGKVREPQHLFGFIRTVAVRQTCEEIRTAGRDRRRFVGAEEVNLVSQARTPEQLAIEQENRERMTAVLRSMRPRDREVLMRFYLKGHRPTQIFAEMGLSETQFRLTKSRAKARLTDRSRRSVGRSAAV